jgi:hypothetical protein
MSVPVTIVATIRTIIGRKKFMTLALEGIFIVSIPAEISIFSEPGGANTPVSIARF